MTIAIAIVQYLTATALAPPDAVVRWVFRVTPAAGFAVLHGIPQYPHVPGVYVPAEGFYPLAPWAGLAASCGYAALAVSCGYAALAVLGFRRVFRL